MGATAYERICSKSSHKISPDVSGDGVVCCFGLPSARGYMGSACRKTWPTVRRSRASKPRATGSGVVNGHSYGHAGGLCCGAIWEADACLCAS